MLRPDKIEVSYKDAGFDSNLQRPGETAVSKGQYIGGSNFAVALDDLLFNRMIKLRNVATTQFPQKADPGKIFWDQDNKKFKLYVDGNSQFVDILWTSTSTTSSSSSSSSTSTSSTSTSTTTT